MAIKEIAQLLESGLWLLWYNVSTSRTYTGWVLSLRRAIQVSKFFVLYEPVIPEGSSFTCFSAHVVRLPHDNVRLLDQAFPYSKGLH